MSNLHKQILAVSMVAALGPSLASAGGFYTARFGGEHGGVTGQHVVSIYYNPAGIADSEDTSVYAEALVAHRTATYDRPVEAIDNLVEGDSGTGTPDYASSANAGRASLTNWLAAPFLGAASRTPIPNLSVGLALYAPFGGSANWDMAADERYPSFPGGADGVQRWWAMDGQLKSLYVSGAAAYRIPKANLDVGVSVSYVTSSVNTIRARTATGTDDMLSSTGDVVEGRSLLDVSSTDVALGLGVMWKPVAKLRLGASYQSQPGFGQMTMAGELKTKLGSTPMSSTPVEMTQSLPDVIRIGGEYAATSRLAFNAQVVYQRWSAFDKQCIVDANIEDRNCALTEDGAMDPEAGGSGVLANFPRDWQSSWTLGAGARFAASPRFEIMGGVSYDQSAVPDSTLDPALMDMDKFAGTAGVRFQISKRFKLSAQLSHVLYMDRSIAPRDRDENGRAMAPASPSRSPDAAGDYSQAITFGTIGAETSF
jgi:long-chain fatty acid transport protein